MSRTPRPLLDRIVDKLDQTDPAGCWNWTGATTFGYGVVGLGRRADGTRQVHRVMYELLIGAIPDGLQLDHLCRNRSCANPWHLEPVTRRENILRGEAPAAIHARKTQCHRGHPFDDSNTSITATGRRRCRTCHRENEARYKRERVGVSA